MSCIKQHFFFPKILTDKTLSDQGIFISSGEIATKGNLDAINCPEHSFIYQN